jgi:hypothetical protein
MYQGRPITPEEMERAAKFLLDNQDFNMLCSIRMSDLARETMSLTEKDEVMAAHTDYKGVEDFVNWLEVVKEGNYE